jgi:ferredoxin
MRVCPTNVIQPAGVEGGLEGLWTPVLNNRIGSSGCQLNCVACGQVCPTSAIRPITLDEKKGLGDFADKGPVKLGTAFVDRNRCLPWSMDKPCIVCQENCPVSPKAIYTQDVFETVRDGIVTVKKATNSIIELDQRIPSGKFGTGDYYVLLEDGNRYKIASNTDTSIGVSEGHLPSVSGKVEIQVRLQRPCVDVEKCIGCGVCEHECPVSGKRAIRVSSEGETRSEDRRLLLK